jgi:hypothetical protein
MEEAADEEAAWRMCMCVCRAPMSTRCCESQCHRIYRPVSLRDQQPLCCPYQSRHLLLYPPHPPPHRAHASAGKCASLAHRFF